MHGIDRETHVRTGPGEDLYDPRRTDAVYDHLEQLALGVLKAGWSVIVDATFLKARHRRRFCDLAERCQAAFSILEIRASASLLRERLLRRAADGGDASDATVEIVDYQRKQLEALGTDEAASVISIDTSAPDAVERAVARIPA